MNYPFMLVDLAIVAALVLVWVRLAKIPTSKQTPLDRRVKVLEAAMLEVKEQMNELKDLPKHVLDLRNLLSGSLHSQNEDICRLEATMIQQGEELLKEIRKLGEAIVRNGCSAKDK